MATKGMGRTIGAANVKIMPDTKGFAQKLKDNLLNIEHKTKLRVRAEIDSAALRNSAERAIDQLDRIFKVNVEASVHLSSLIASASRAVEAANNAAGNINVEALIDQPKIITAAHKAVESAEAAAGKIDVETTIDEQQLAKKARNAAHLAVLHAQSATHAIDIPAEIDTEDLRHRLSKAIDEVGAFGFLKSDIQIAADFDQHGLVEKINSAVQAVQEFAKVDVDADVDSADLVQSAKASIRAVETAIDSIRIEPQLGDPGKIAREANRTIKDAEKILPPLRPDMDVDSPGFIARVKAACIAAAQHAKVNVDLDVKDGLSRFGSGLSAIMGPVGAVSAGLGKISAVAGGATAGIAGLAAHVASLVQALGPGVAQVGALAAAMGPSGLGAAALGVGTLKTAFSGLNEVLEAKTIEELGPALEHLSPAAREFAGDLLSLRERFGELGEDIQEKFFANFSNFGDIATLMDPLQEAMGDVAVDLGNAAAGVVDFLTQGSGFEAFNVLLDNSANIAGRVGDTLGSLFQGIIAAGAAASPIVSALSEKIAEMAEAWAQKMVAGFEDGSLTAYFERALETLKSFWGFIQDLGGIVSGVFSAMAASGGPLLGMLGAGADALNNWVNSAEGMTTLTDFFSMMAGAVDAVLPIVGQLGNIILTTLAPAFVQTVEALAPFVQMLLESLKPALDSLAPVLPVVAQAIGEGITAMAPLLPVVAQAIADILLAVAPLIPQLAELATEILIPMIPTIATMIEGFAKIIEILIPMAPAIMGVVGAFVVLANPIGAVVAAVGLLVGALVNHWPEIENFFSDLGQSISDGFSRFGEWLSGVGDTIVTGFNNATSAAGDTISGFWNTTTSVFQIAGEQISGFTSAAWESVKEHFHQGVSIGLDTVAGFAGTIGDTFYRIKDVLTSTFSKAWSDLKDAASNGVGGILDYVGSIPSRSLEALGNIGKILFDSGKALIRGFIDGIKRMIGNVKDAAADVVQAARDFFPFSPAKKGPFSGRGWVLYSGKSIGEAFAEGIRGTAQTVATAARGVITDARDAFDEIDIAFQGGDWGYGTLEKYFGEGISRAIVDGASHAGDTLRAQAAQSESLREAGQAMGKTIGDAMAHAVADLSDISDELTIAFDGGDWGYGTLEKYLGTKSAQVLTKFASQAGETYRKVTGTIHQFRTDAVDAYDEIQIAFDGGDWGYGTLEKYLGTKSAQVLTKFASQAGETYRQVTRQIQEFTAAVNSEISEHVQQANQVVEEIRRPFDEAAAPMVEAGRSLGEAFAQGIADTQRQIEEAANNAVGAARDFFPFSPAKKGPFSGRGWVLYSGKAVGSAFAQGIADTAADAAAAAAKIATTTRNNLDSVVSATNTVGNKPGAPGSRLGGDYSVHVGTVVAADPTAPLREIEAMQRAAQIRGGGF